MEIIRKGYQLTTNYSIEDFIEKRLISLLEINWDTLSLSYVGSSENDIEHKHIEIKRKEVNKVDLYLQVMNFIKDEILYRINSYQHIHFFVEYTIMDRGS